MTEVVYRTLRDEISRGIYRPNQIRLKLLAQRFGVSAVPVREALRRLEAEGLVSFGPNRRITINRLTRSSLNEIFAIRSELEALALRHAIPGLHGSPQQIGAIEDLLRQMDEQEQTPQDWQTTNRQFHAALYALSGMSRLESIISSLWAASDPYLRLYVNSVGTLRTSQDEHRKMLREILDGRTEDATATLRDHIGGTWETLKQYIGEGEQQLDSQAEAAGHY